MIPFLPIAIVAAIGAHKLALNLDTHRKPRDASVLLATFSTPYMAEIARGASGDYYYSAMVAIGNPEDLAAPPHDNVPNAWTGGAIYRVDLPFITKVHLLGIPKTEPAQVDPSGDHMEPVALEGDFPRYFSLYAEIGQQVESRYILDPAAMQFIVDFCSTHHWEIVGDQLIFLHANISTDHDPVALMKIVQEFIDHIKPAIERPISEERQMQRASYGQERRGLLCPLCGTLMTNQGKYLLCPQGHGMLAYGRVLADIRKKLLHVDIRNPVVLQHEGIRCPSCHHDMTKMAYDATQVMIDSCTHCPYRWLDADEVAEIKLNDRLADLDIGTPLDTMQFEARSHPHNPYDRSH